MKLSHPFIQLPLQFDAEAMAAEILALGEACWHPHPQGYEGNTMLPLVAINGDPANEFFAGSMRPTAALLASPYLMQVLTALGATIGRTRLMRLSGHAEVKRHVDQGYYWAERVRVHIPVITQPTVRFECGDAVTHMATGECWIFDTWRQHRVVNDAIEARIHLVVDTVGGAAFQQLVTAGRRHVGAEQEWLPRAIPYVAGGHASFPLESFNIPSVMTPWEMRLHFDRLFSEALPHPDLARVQAAADQLVYTWRGLWAAYSDQADGAHHYRAAIEQFVGEMKRTSLEIALRNEIRWFNAMMALVGVNAIRIHGAAHSRVMDRDNG